MTLRVRDRYLTLYRIVLEATNQKALNKVSMDDLRRFAVDKES